MPVAITVSPGRSGMAAFCARVESWCAWAPVVVGGTSANKMAPTRPRVMLSPIAVSTSRRFLLRTIRG